MQEQKNYRNGQSAESERLFEAVAKGAVGQVDKLLSRGAFPDCRGSEGRIAFIEACQSGNAAMVGAFLRHHVDVNIVGADGETALTGAAGRGHLEVVKVLVSNGADLGMRNSDGFTASEVAEVMGHDPVKDYLEAQSVSSTSQIVTMETSTNQDEDGRTTDDRAEASPAVTGAPISSSEPRSFVTETESMPEISTKAAEANSVETAGAGSEAAAHEQTERGFFEGILDRFTGKDKSTVVWARPYDMYQNGVFKGLYKSTVDRMASDIKGIVITSIFHAYLLIGYYLLAAFFDNDESLVFSKNPYKETSLNDLAKRDDIPFTRQRTHRLH